MSTKKTVEMMKKDCLDDVSRWLSEMEARGMTTEELDLRIELLRAVNRHLTENAPVTTTGYNLESLYPFHGFPMFAPPSGGAGLFPSSES